ncbi:heavy metal translocating P-type ATPase [Hathewaya histolytica]|uniref:Cd(2+)-exporting ATPase n=1 Tax=Hathewaya histolytica TaxID=1498 RepID=A0A4V6KEK3_HATHI|nr:heavy metal translocating P-type ATPase [Hathewaya histolytica]VTQ94467.1 heavy metal-translocating P-type ATPase [Hathewaya histolytica]
MSEKRDFKFILKGLDCANCAAKIEERVKNLSTVESAVLNFSTSLLTVTIKQGVNKEIVTSEIEAIVKKLEPDVEIIETVKNSKSTSKMSLILEGLHCANCAAKIESKVNNLEAVKEASFNFSNSTLNIEFEKFISRDELFNSVKNIVDSTEPGVKVKYKNTSTKTTTKQKLDKSYVVDKNTLIRLSLGTILFIIGLIMKFDFYPKLAIFLVSYILIGKNVLLKALSNIKKGDVFDENFLMTIATIGAFAIKDFPEAVAVMLFYEVGETFQDIAVNRSRNSIADLMDIRPDKANLKIGDSIEEVSPEDVSIGDIIVIKPYEKVPLDGFILDGDSSMDTSALTGESLPRDVKKGDEILSGFINKNGVLTLKVTKDFSESTVSKILDLVENAGSKKAETEKFITKFARVYTPLVVMAAIALAFIPPMIIKDSNLLDWVQRALSFLVVSCPCALVISVPLGFFGGIGAASKSGVLVKGSNYLEALNDLETVVFDKTGTLTKGVFEVNNLYPAEGIKKEDLLKYAALCEAYSSHPIGTSIIKAYGKKVEKDKLKNYEEIPGHGIKTEFDGKTILTGNSKLMNKFGVNFIPSKDIGTSVYVAVDNNFFGSITISDKIKEDAKDAISMLKSYGIKNLVMLTGDNKTTAENVANTLDITEVHAELLPGDKVSIFENIMAKKSPKAKVAFIGDGINDAPVLARADVGFAMGGLGSDAAIEAADVVIMTDEPSKISNSIKIAKFTRKIVTENIYFALGVKLIVLLLIALGLATMWAAVFADVGVALLAVMNSMRVLKVK